MGKAKYFSSIDLAITYHYVRIAKGDIQKTVFFTNEDLYKYIVMIFGLFNALLTLQSLINFTLVDFTNEFVIIYLDDILAYYETYL